MPHIRIRALSENAVKNLSRELPKQLAELMQTSEDNFSIELVGTTFYKNGNLAEGDPMLEVLWFDRGQSVKDASAKKITELVQKETSAQYISVVFTAIEKESYFENGKHF